jgi:hypothetical protein
LKLNAAGIGSRQDIALNEWKIDLGSFPVGVAGSLKVNLAFDEADADDSGFDVVIVGVFIIGANGGDGSKEND